MLSKKPKACFIAKQIWQISSLKVKNDSGFVLVQNLAFNEFEKFEPSKIKRFFKKINAL